MNFKAITTMTCIGLCGGLAACAFQSDYTKPGITQQQLSADYSQCEAVAERVESVTQYPPTPIPQLGYGYARALDQCMKGKGYVEK